MSDKTLRISDLTIEYERNGYTLRPIDGMNQHAQDGELVLLLGPSGCGKTTLLSCIAGLLRPSGGQIRVRDTEVTSLEGAALTAYRRHGVGIVFQSFNLVASLTIVENVMAPLRLAGVGRVEAQSRAYELLDRVDLGDRRSHRPAELSGGQQQRVAIARALAHDPALIVADEPTAHLDFVQVEGVLRLLRDLAVPGRLVVVATHDDRFRPLADRVIDLTPQATGDESAVDTVILTAGEILFREGDPPDFVFLVEAGTVEVFRERSDGTEEKRTEFAVGDYFGELGPMLGIPRSATVRAVEPARVRSMGLQAFRNHRAGRS